MRFKILNFILFQAGWWACVLGAVHGHAWLGPLFVSAIVGFHLFLRPDAGREAVLLLIVGILGTLIDSLQQRWGVLLFKGGGRNDWLCPLWISALWVIFGITLNASLKWLQGRYFLAAFFGILGGPLSYWAGVRLGVIQFPLSDSFSLIGLAMEWVGVMPLFSFLAKKISPPLLPSKNSPQALKSLPADRVYP